MRYHVKPHPKNSEYIDSYHDQRLIPQILAIRREKSLEGIRSVAPEMRQIGLPDLQFKDPNFHRFKRPIIFDPQSNRLRNAGMNRTLEI